MGISCMQIKKQGLAILSVIPGNVLIHNACLKVWHEKQLNVILIMTQMMTRCGRLWQYRNILIFGAACKFMTFEKGSNLLSTYL